MNRKILVIATVFVCLLSSASYAQVTHYVSQYNSNLYQYDYKELEESYINFKLGFGNAQLYEHYKKGTVKALVDSKNGYVDFNDVSDAYLYSKMEGKTFDLNKYTESTSVKLIKLSNIKNLKVINGQVVEMPVVTDPSKEPLKVISIKSVLK